MLLNVQMSEGYSFGDAYGKILGTLLVCCWWSVALSFMPPRMLKRVFPPVVSSLLPEILGFATIATDLTLLQFPDLS